MRIACEGMLPVETRRSVNSIQGSDDCSGVASRGALRLRPCFHLVPSKLKGLCKGKGKKDRRRERCIRWSLWAELPGRFHVWTSTPLLLRDDPSRINAFCTLSICSSVLSRVKWARKLFRSSALTRSTIIWLSPGYRRSPRALAPFRKSHVALLASAVNAPRLARICGDVAFFLFGRFCVAHVAFKKGSSRTRHSRKFIQHLPRSSPGSQRSGVLWLCLLSCQKWFFHVFARIQMSVWTHLRLQEELVPASYSGRQAIQPTFQGTSKIPHDNWWFFLTCRTTHWESGWRLAVRRLYQLTLNYLLVWVAKRFCWPPTKHRWLHLLQYTAKPSTCFGCTITVATHWWLTSFTNARQDSHSKRWQLFLLAFEAFFTLATHPVFHVPRTVCPRFGFRAFQQCKRTALLQSIGILVWAVWCSEQSVPAVSNCTHEGGHLTSHLASALSKQDVHDSCSLCLTQQKDFLHHRRLTRWHTTRHFHRAGHVSLQLHVSQFLGIWIQFPSRSCGNSIIFVVSVDYAFVLMRSDWSWFCSTNLGWNEISISASSLYSSYRGFEWDCSCKPSPICLFASCSLFSSSSLYHCDTHLWS